MKLQKGQRVILYSTANVFLDNVQAQVCVPKSDSTRKEDIAVVELTEDFTLPKGTRIRVPHNDIEKENK